MTTPLLLLDLCLLAGTPGIDIVALFFADLGMILTGLFASLEEQTSYKWGWYAMSCAFFLYLIYVLVVNGRTSAAARGQKVQKLFDSVALFTLVLWTLYPVAWGFSEGIFLDQRSNRFAYIQGANILNVDQEIAVYAILDVLAKAVFGLWLLTGHMNIPECMLDFCLQMID